MKFYELDEPASGGYDEEKNIFFFSVHKPVFLVHFSSSGSFFRLPVFVCRIVEYFYGQTLKFSANQLFFMNQMKMYEDGLFMGFSEFVNYFGRRFMNMKFYTSSLMFIFWR